MKKLLNVSAIVIGVVIASFGEIDFVLTGFLYQLGGIVFEAIRIVMVERLLSGAEFKMDPLVSLYYYAPVCAVMNLTVALFWEIPSVTMEQVYAVGLGTLFLNASVAFCLNVSVVFLVRLLLLYFDSYTKQQSTDWQDLRPRPHPLRCLERYPPGCRLRHHLGNHDLDSPDLRLQYRPRRNALVQARPGEAQGSLLKRQPLMG